MSIEELVKRIVEVRAAHGQAGSHPASDREVDKLAAEFQRGFNRPLPLAYARVLRVANGLSFNGLTMWPTTRTGSFRESLVEANEDFRETLSDRFLYFGQCDEELYVFELVTGVYKAVEFVGLPTWETFKDDEQMVSFMLSRALAHLSVEGA